MNHVLDGGPDPHTRRGNFDGKKGPAQDMSEIDILNATRQRAAPVRCGCRSGCTLVTLGAYD